MIQKLSVQRFKSIRSLSIDCRKVNLFIGAPDTGKTNILEALYFMSRLGWNFPLDTSLRLSQEFGFDHLFYRQFFDQPFEIALDNKKLKGTIEGQDRHLIIDNMGNRIVVTFGSSCHLPEYEWIRIYSYLGSEHWQYASTKHGDRIVTPPHGSNLMYLARHHSQVYDFLKETVAELDWKLRFDAAHKKFRLSEVRKEEILDYSLDLLSDSRKRLFFYGSIILTSENATLVWDEPDVFAFPPYPKILGEMIAHDASNQFFLSTHNPYFLSAVLEKTPAEKLSLFVCYRNQDGSTEAKHLGHEKVQQVIEWGASAFFNLEDLIEQ